MFIVRDDDGDEQIAAFAPPGGRRLEPMIATSEARLEQLLEVAQDLVARDPSKPMMLTKFSSREDLAEVVVDGASD